MNDFKSDVQDEQDDWDEEADDDAGIPEPSIWGMPLSTIDGEEEEEE